MTRIPHLVKKINAALGTSQSGTISRRTFMQQSSNILWAGAGLAPLWRYKSRTEPVIAIIGAGLSGLTAAYHLEKAGLQATIYEAQSRVGGRIISTTGMLAPGITTEMGGEFIDSTHQDVLRLCREFRLPLLDMQAASEKKLVGIDYFFSGRRISENEIIKEFQQFVPRIKKDMDAIPDSQDPSHPKMVALDRLSIDAYLQGIGMSGWLYDVLTTSFTSELGIPSGEQTSLNMLLSLHTDTSRGFEIYGDSDERFKVAGGNERIPLALRNRLKSTFKTDFHLKRITSKGDGYVLSFENGQQVNADIVIMTVPFSVLREMEIRIDMPEKKKQCIQELGYGMQSKLFIGVKERIWREQGYSGYVLSDEIHNGWDSSQMQHHNTGEGGYSLFLGADKGVKLTINDYDRYLAACDTVFPGMKQHANGKKNSYNWNHNPLAKGAYACYKVGQIAKFGHQEGRPVGNMYFAGEHCSEQFQGFMNGAAETGRHAAENILKKLGKPRDKNTKMRHK